MTMADIGRRANDLGIVLGHETRRMTKSELIRAIQQAKGNAECYGQLGPACSNKGCSFRRDCTRAFRASRRGGESLTMPVDVGCPFASA
jgi:hypothetical protein